MDQIYMTLMATTLNKYILFIHTNNQLYICHMYGYYYKLRPRTMVFFKSSFSSGMLLTVPQTIQVFSQM